MTGSLGVTWWGHSSATVELGNVRLGTDPLLSDWLFHLRRDAPAPPAAAADVDLVIVSHQHHDHLHPPSLRRLPEGIPLVVPRGTAHLVRGAHRGPVQEVVPGDVIELAGLRIEVLSAFHDGRRHLFSRGDSPALGFRVSDGTRAVWYPGDTGLTEAMAEVDPVDLALVPIGGWGPSLGDEHLDPGQAAEAVRRVGATWSVPVHYGTFWPVGLRRIHPDSHRRLFVTPSSRFVEEVRSREVPTEVRLVPHGERIELVPDMDGS